MHFGRWVVVLVLVASGAATAQAAAHATSITRLKGAVDALIADSNAVAADVLARDYASLKADCRALRDDAGRVAAIRRPGHVKRTSWRQLKTAVSNYYNAAALCIGATKGRATPSVPLLRATSEALDDATTAMSLATASL
jgi:hypothetical protein